MSCVILLALDARIARRKTEISRFHIRVTSASQYSCHSKKTKGRIDPIYLSGQAYYLVPDGKPGEGPFAVVQHAMKQEHKVAIARVVMHGKEQLVMVRPIGDLLAVQVLDYDFQVNKPEAYEEMVPPDPGGPGGSRDGPEINRDFHGREIGGTICYLLLKAPLPKTFSLPRLNGEVRPRSRPCLPTAGTGGTIHASALCLRGRGISGRAWRCWKIASPLQT